MLLTISTVFAVSWRVVVRGVARVAPSAMRPGATIGIDHLGNAPAVTLEPTHDAKNLRHAHCNSAEHDRKSHKWRWMEHCTLRLKNPQDVQSISLGCRVYPRANRSKRYFNRGVRV